MAPKKSRVQVYLSEALYQRLHQFCQDHNYPLSQGVTLMIEAFFDPQIGSDPDSQDVQQLFSEVESLKGVVDLLVRTQQSQRKETRRSQTPSLQSVGGR